MLGKAQFKPDCIYYNTASLQLIAQSTEQIMLPQKQLLDLLLTSVCSCSCSYLMISELLLEKKSFSFRRTFIRQLLLQCLLCFTKMSQFYLTLHCMAKGYFNLSFIDVKPSNKRTVVWGEATTLLLKNHTKHPKFLFQST